MRVFEQKTHEIGEDSRKYQGCTCKCACEDCLALAGVCECKVIDCMEEIRVVPVSVAPLVPLLYNSDSFPWWAIKFTLAFP